MEEAAKKTPKVSIGMPVYNGEQFIREALDSLLAQTFTDFELIISDNASTDGTEAICREYAVKDARVRYVRWPENRGGLANFSFVLNEAVGEYFMWASHDDVWMNDFIRRCIDCLSRNYQAVAAITRSIYDKSSDFSGDSPLNSKFLLIRQIKFLIHPGPNSRFYSLYRSSAVKKINLSSYNYHAGDWAFVFDMLCFGDYCRDDSYVGFVKRGGGAGSKPLIVNGNNLQKFLLNFFPLRRFYLHVLKQDVARGLILFPWFVRLNLINYVYLRNAK